MDATPIDQLVLFAGVLLAFPLTLLWIGAHALGLIRLGGGLSAVSSRAKMAWLLSFGGGFLGPCVILAALVSMGMALAERRQPDATDETRQVSGTVLLAGAILLVMAAVLTASVLISVVLGG